MEARHGRSIAARRVQRSTRQHSSLKQTLKEISTLFLFSFFFFNPLDKNTKVRFVLNWLVLYRADTCQSQRRKCETSGSGSGSGGGGRYRRWTAKAMADGGASRLTVALCDTLSPQNEKMSNDYKKAIHLHVTLLFITL